jgi:hypothetical protein
VAGLFWEESIVGWWLISQTNRLRASHGQGVGRPASINRSLLHVPWRASDGWSLRPTQKSARPTASVRQGRDIRPSRRRSQHTHTHLYEHMHAKPTPRSSDGSRKKLGEGFLLLLLPLVSPNLILLPQICRRDLGGAPLNFQR